MVFNRLNGSNIVPTNFSRQMSAFDFTLDLSGKDIQAEISQGSAMGSSSLTNVLLLWDWLAGCG